MNPDLHSPSDQASTGGVGGQLLPEPVAAAASAPPAAGADGVAAPHFAAEIVDDLADVDRFAAFHRAFPAHPESHFDLLCAAFRHGRQARPFFVQVTRDGVPCLLVVGQLVRGRLRWRLGYRTLQSSPAVTVEVLQGGWLGDVSPPCLEFVCARLYDHLRRGGADAIHLRHVPADSAVHRVFARHPSWLFRDRSPTPSTNWRLRVPESFAEWQRAQPKREREDNKRYDKRIRKDFGDGVRVELLTQEDEIERFAEVVEGIARRTYQRGMEAGFRDTPEARARWRAGAGADALDVRVLWFGDVPIAFCCGFRFDGVLWLEHLGYDPEFRKYRPGMFLLQRAIEDLAAGGAVHAIDFGIGDADYKRRLCDQSRADVSVYLFAPTVRGLWLNSVRGLANCAGRVAERCLDRLGLLSRLKSRWRRALQPQSAPAAGE